MAYPNMQEIVRVTIMNMSRQLAVNMSQTNTMLYDLRRPENAWKDFTGKINKAVDSEFSHRLTADPCDEWDVVKFLVPEI